MNLAPKEWGFYFPDDGETVEDAVPIIGFVFDHDHAAREACEYDFCSRDGWERSGPFKIAVIDPNREVSIWLGEHEPSVTHSVRRALPPPPTGTVNTGE
jgi:hypothetical protein